MDKDSNHLLGAQYVRSNEYMETSYIESDYVVLCMCRFIMVLNHSTDDVSLQTVWGHDWLRFSQAEVCYIALQMS